MKSILVPLSCLLLQGCEQNTTVKYTRERVPIGVLQGKVYEIERRRLKIASQKILFDPDADCPPKSFKLANGDIVNLDISAASMKPLDRWHSVHSLDKKYSLHMLTSFDRGLKEVYNAKAAFLIANGLDGLMVKAFEIDSTQDLTGESCAQISIVTSYGGALHLSDLLKDRPQSMKKMFLIASRIIRTVRALNALGQTTGGLDTDSFSFHSLENIENELVLSNSKLGGKPFVDIRSGYHVFSNVDTDTTIRSGVPTSFQSPRQVLGRRLSRADDMIHVANILYTLLGYPSLPSETGIEHLEEWLERPKLKRIPAVYPAFNEFYAEMIDLSFYARPDYEKWIDRFESESK